MFSLSFREPAEMDLLIPKNIRFDNYSRAIELANDRDYPLRQMYKNSIIVSFFSLGITIIVSMLAAYAFSKMKFRFNTPIFYVLLVGMMIPIQMLFLR